MTYEALKPGIYQHYKGPEYEVLDVVRHSEMSFHYAATLGCKAGQPRRRQSLGRLNAT